MDKLTPEQRSQLEISQVYLISWFLSTFIFLLAQFKEFMTTYNTVTEHCFDNCVKDFTSRKIQKKEVGFYLFTE